MAGTSRNDLVSKLRSRISDERTIVSAFSLAIGTPGTCKNAFLEISNGFLSVTIEGGVKVPSIRLNLSDPKVSTVGKLINVLDKLDGYLVTPETSVVSGHPSSDLNVNGLPDISQGKGETLYHHIFSDEELLDVLTEAISLHNPNYTSITTVPKPEYPYVLLKASAHCYRILASDTAKRRGLETDAKVYLQLAKDCEEQYARDHRRMERIIPAPKADESKMGAGDVVVGMMFRRTLRSGYNASYRNSLPPTPPNLYDVADDDAGDTDMRLRWSQNREQSFSYYEVWRDTQPNVERSISGRLVNAFPNNTAALGGGPDLPISSQYSRASTSRQVLGVSAGANRVSPVFDGFFFWTAAELAGSNIVNATFIDGLIFNNPGGGNESILGEPLEPDTDYYYRVYAINWNGEVVMSRVLKVHTKTFRARFLRTPGTQGFSNSQNGTLDPNSILPTRGPLAGGTTLTIRGTNFPATGLEVLINGKQCTNVTQISSSQITCVTPGFVNVDWILKPVDVVLLSQNGLKDFIQRGFTYTQ